MAKFNVDAVKTALTTSHCDTASWGPTEMRTDLWSGQANRQRKRTTWKHRIMRVMVFGLVAFAIHFTAREWPHVLPAATVTSCKAPKTTTELLYRNVPGTKSFDASVACSQ